MKQTSALREGLLAEETFKALFESAPDAVLVVDAGGKIVAVNPQAERMFGYQAHELQGQPIEQLVPARFHGAHTKHRHGYATNPSSRGMGSGLDLSALHKSGREFPVEISLSPLRHRERMLVSAAVRDVTDRKRVQDELRRARDELEDRVRERTAELAAQVAERRAAEERLLQSQKMDAVGQLTGGIAHDFNNLLTIILANLQMLEDEVKLGSVARDLADSATRAALRGAELTRKLLVFARRQQLEATPVDVNELVTGMTAMLARTLGEHIRVVERLTVDLPLAFVDAAQLETSLLNLAVNARDAMPHGGQLSIETKEVVVDATRAAPGFDLVPGAYVCVKVADTGVGMTSEVMTRAFEPFFTTKETGKGTGLGLSMVYGFATQSGGKVDLQSELGRGTSVSLYLPQAKRDDVAIGHSTQSRRGEAETVLLVEDDDDVRRATTKLLVGLGYQVLPAASADAALATLAREPQVQLLFTDVVLANGMSGPELAREARRLRPALRILFMSGHVQDTAAFREELERDAHFLGKPFRKEELAQKLRSVLGEPRS